MAVASCEDVVRELENIIERALILEHGELIRPESVLLHRLGMNARAEEPAAGIPGGIVPLERLEREMVQRALAAAGGNQTRAASMRRRAMCIRTASSGSVGSTT